MLPGRSDEKGYHVIRLRFRIIGQNRCCKLHVNFKLVNGHASKKLMISIQTNRVQHPIYKIRPIISWRSPFREWQSAKYYIWNMIEKVFWHNKKVPIESITFTIVQNKISGDGFILYRNRQIVTVVRVRVFVHEYCKNTDLHRDGANAQKVRIRRSKIFFVNTNANITTLRSVTPQC